MSRENHCGNFEYRVRLWTGSVSPKRLKVRELAPAKGKMVFVMGWVDPEKDYVFLHT